MAEEVNVRDLQPTDVIRSASQEFMQSLDLTRLLELGAPQVWLLNGRLLISDGNQRTVQMAKRGHTRISVDLQRDAGNYGFILEEAEERARFLRSQGIYNPYDLIARKP